MITLKGMFILMLDGIYCVDVNVVIHVHSKSKVKCTLLYIIRSSSIAACIQIFTITRDLIGPNDY